MNGEEETIVLALAAALGLVFLFAGTVGLRKIAATCFPGSDRTEKHSEFFFPAVGICLLLLALTFSDAREGPAPGDREFFERLLYGALFFFALSLVPIYVALRNRGISSLGIRRPTWREMWGGALAYPCFLPIYFFSGAIWFLFLSEGLGIEGRQKILEGIANLQGAELLVAGVLGVLLQPFLEEMVFRGFVQTTFQSKFGGTAGLVAASAVFAVNHEFVAWGPIFALACFLGFLFQKTGKLWVCYLVHAMHNGIVFLLPLASQDIRRYLSGS